MARHDPINDNPDALTFNEYDSAAEKFATHLLDAYDETPEWGEIIETVSERATTHGWFTRTYYDVTLYASVVGHAKVCATDEPDDWQTACDEPECEDAIERMALDWFITDVTERVLYHAGHIGEDA